MIRPQPRSVSHYRQGAMGDATTAMHKALLSDPGHKAAAANLGAFLRIGGEVDAVEALLREAIASDGGNIAAKLNLTADLLQEE